jgi:predicted kinase
MRKANLYIPIGIPGCGKSTWAKQFFDSARVHIASTDAIRESLGDVNDQSKNDQVFARFHEEISDCMVDRLDVVADATNLTRRARERLIAIGAYQNTHAILFTNTAQALLRNAKRERVVPAHVMERMLAHYERTLLDLSHEHYTSRIEIASYDS